MRNSRTGILSLLCVIAALLALAACQGDDEVVKNIPFAPDLKSTEQLKVLDFQDRQLTDSLLPYFNHSDPSLRYRAAMAFASIRDSTAIHALGRLLRDDNVHVRHAAAFALGQTGASQAETILTKGFDGYDSLQRYAISNRAILEAVGKTGSMKSLRFLSSTTTYTISDSSLVLGQARGIYRFALRGMVSPEGTKRMTDLLASDHLPVSIRLVAANYFLRATGIDMGPHLPTLVPLMRTEKDPRIRMCLVNALGKSRDLMALDMMINGFRAERDYRVQCNMLRAFQYYDYYDVHDVLMGALRHDNLHVARTAAQVINNIGKGDFALEYRQIARAPLPWEVKTLCYKTANAFLSNAYAITKSNMQNELTLWFERSTNPYERAAIIEAIGAEFTDHGVVRELGYDDPHPAVRTAAVATLSSILSDQRFNQKYPGASGRPIRSEIANHLFDAVRSGDVAMIAEASIGLADPSVRAEVVTRKQDLVQALSKLKLPKAIETYNALDKCIATITGKEFSPRKPEWNHPVEWSEVSKLPDTLMARVQTNRGEIRIQLLRDTAPATVLNFVELSRDSFYDGKAFHRVVPNFVIQTGCPRGDGYGSLDYTIRSELKPVYYDKGGYVGMASAGNHTECTQWFITHSPTPHLDANYTIFGRVVSGMDVVHEIQPGDVVQKVIVDDLPG